MENISMKAMVIYDSVFGNTEQIARAIGNALGSEEVETFRVGNVKPGQLAGLKLLIVGLRRGISTHRSDARLPQKRSEDWP
jgi:flavodoxin